MRKTISARDLYNYFTIKGFSYSWETITRYYISLKAKPFVILSGISGTGKTKIAQLFAQYICQEENGGAEKRVAFVAVRPDWIDNKGLLGFYNILEEKYHSTKVLDLLLEAQEHPDKPYFVILDEMNLAKVEHYFSDFLSVMESRTPDRPQGETINLHPLEMAETLDGRIIPGSLHIPANVFFSGTVNVDESTYMFSPKVLDRANVIEFNEVHLNTYTEGTVDKVNLILLGTEVLDRFYSPSDRRYCNREDYQNLPEDGKSYLVKLLAILKEHNLHFGYRVANELSRFVNLASAELADFKIDEAMDIQIIQKILPKLHGTRAKLEEPLRNLLVFCYDQSTPPSDEQVKEARSYDLNARFPRSAQKIAQMLNQLTVQGYVSFIE